MKQFGFSRIENCLSLCLLCAATAIALPAQTFTTLVNFNGANGAYPYAGMVQATNGELFGTTDAGGIVCAGQGCGTVFRVTLSGKLTTSYGFCSQTNCADGSYPYAALTLASSGYLYGTTYFGGANGDGAVFRITTGGKLTTLHSFDGTDGKNPVGTLVQATDGNLYGTTEYGGANTYGTVFKISQNGAFTLLYSFCSETNCADGSVPFAGLIEASNGYLYGATYYGGANGYGTIFKISFGGLLTTLHSFDNADGSNPYGGLVQASNGNLYGTTNYGASTSCYSGCGTVFKMTPGGSLTTLHKFTGTDGGNPQAALIQATDGNLYGTTATGGTDSAFPGGCGTVFAITPTGTLTILHSFDFNDGLYPVGGPVRG